MQRGYQDTGAAGLILGALLPVQDPHDPPLHSSAVLPTAPPRRLGCTLHATIYFFNIMLTNGSAHE